MTDTNGNDAKKLLNGYINRVENLTEQKKDLMEDIKNVFIEAKGEGIDVKALKEVIRRRSKNRGELEAFEAIVETYESAIDA